MAQYNDFEELAYEGTIEEEGGGFVLLPEGDYAFTVNKVTRTRYEGGEKMPACNMVTVDLTVHGTQGDAYLTERFYLLRKFEWKLSQFFLSIGMKRHGEPLVMNWSIEGRTGRCRVYVDTYRRRDGSGDGQSNKVKKFYAYDDAVTVAAPQSTAPPPYQPPKNGGWKAGSF